MQVYGIDLSMEKFDVNYIDQDGNERNKQVKNRLENISKFLSKVPQRAILCAEHTGCYGDLLVFICNQMGIEIALVPGVTIKHSFGMLKGVITSYSIHYTKLYDMLAIFVGCSLNLFLSIILSSRMAFDKFDNVKNIFFTK